METTLKTVCPRDCYDACGIVVTKVDGRIKNVRGDRDHPVARGKLCRKCSIGYNGVFLDEGARLTHPLRRSGAKGSGQFERISWDEAIADCAARLGAIARDHGASSILHTHYTGTLSLLAFLFGNRFFHRLGATEVDPDTVCNKAGHVALEYVYGASEIGFDPRTVGDASCILVWGANPSACGPHQHEHWLGEAAATVVVIDPIRTDTAAAAEIHLQPRPGADAALAFGLMHVLARDGLIDRDYLAQNAVGFDELEPLLAACTPEWTERETDVPAALVERVARLYGSGPSLLWLGQGLQRQPLGGNIFRAVSLLPAVTGNLGKPGAGFCYMNTAERVGVDYDYLTASHLAVDPPDPVSQMDLADVLADAERSRALVCWNINVASSNPRQEALRAALAREDLYCVAIDIFPTDTTALADLVLPAASFLEFDDLMASYFEISLSAQVQASEPVGEALPNQEIFRRLAAAMGFHEPELHEPDRAIIDRVLQASGTGETFASLAAKGTVWPHAEVLLQFADGAFPTPSGKIEIASARAEADGLPRVPQPSADARTGGSRLRLLSPASPWTMNGTFANDCKIVRRMGVATVGLHPAEAAARGLAEGAEVELSNATGTLRLHVELSDRLPRGVALVPKGRWGVNVNVLNHGAKTDMGESSAVHGVEVEITPV